MRKLRIVSDSSSDLLTLTHADFACSPMKIITAEREFVDDENLDVEEMANFSPSSNKVSAFSNKLLVS